MSFCSPPMPVCVTRGLFQSCCPICLEPWTASGDHRIVCLACGHLFGESCVLTWLKVGTWRGGLPSPMLALDGPAM